MDVTPPSASITKESSSSPDVPTNHTHASIDESLYSRQLYVLGHNAMQKMGATDVLISGLGGLGVEAAKNLILGGVRSVTLHDTALCQFSDFSAQFFLSEQDIGSNRAVVSQPHLAKLNSHVTVNVSTSIELTEELLQSFRVVVLTNSSTEEQLKVAEIVRRQGHMLIIAETRGLFAKVFCDFGPKFEVTDSTGENPLSARISDVSNGTEGLVTCLDEATHGFETGDYVSFSEVAGMEELNSCGPRPINVLGPYAFTIGDTTTFSKYTGRGVATQVKRPQIVQFKPLAEALYEPEFLISDWGKLDRPAQLHLAFMTAHEFFKKEGRQPKPWCRQDSQLFIQLAQEVNSRYPDGPAKVEKIDSELLATFSHVCQGVLNPIDATIGGIVAQEVMKACSSKFSPIFQWFYFDATECLPEDCSVLTVEQCKSTGSRYDGQVAVFGAEFQKQLGEKKYFVVGAGAIGCELLKNLAMIGVGAGEGGHVYVTDMDRIEKSNLSRQFLFRENDVMKSKSTTAAKAIKAMNPQVRVSSFEERVGPETEDIFNDDFFGQLHGVANALDNVDARLYMDSRCVYYQKSLIDSGTLGTKGNVQVVVPHLTESYSSSQDPPEKSIPLCTLRSFPYMIEHTLQWARDRFEGLFHQAPEAAFNYLADPDGFMERTLEFPGTQPYETLVALKKFLVDERPTDFDGCIKLARLHFEEEYRNQILQLLFNFPKDQYISEGQLFWSGLKRCPHPLQFNVDDAIHVDYVVAMANLKAKMYNIPENRNRLYIAAKATQVYVDEFVPSSDVYIAATEEDVDAAPAASPNDDERLEKLKAEIPRTSLLPNLRILTLNFEKDDDNNFHMDFVTAASNLRAGNYEIAPADRLESKRIAGNIIPAIATTTSVVSGLACIELLKLVQGHTKVESFKNGFVNLALPFYGFSEPIAAPKQKHYGIEWTFWDHLVVYGEMTLGDFLDYFKNKYKLAITTVKILHGGICLITPFTPAAERTKRLGMPVSEVYELVTKKKPDGNALDFELLCNALGGEEVDVPNVRYFLPANKNSIPSQGSDTPRKRVFGQVCASRAPLVATENLVNVTEPSNGLAYVSNSLNADNVQYVSSPKKKKE